MKSSVHIAKKHSIDEVGYVDILKQVRDHEFEQQLDKRLKLTDQDKQTATQLSDAKLVNEL
ncbi:MAG: hypothetical protein WD491_12825 [Balneolales bacterium]